MKWRRHPIFRNYLFSTLGEVKRVDGRFVNVFESGRYLKITITGFGRRPLHRCILEAWEGFAKSNECVRHLDGDRYNNRLCNLKWGSLSENAKDRTKHGTQNPPLSCRPRDRFHTPSHREKQPPRRRYKGVGCRNCGSKT